MKVKPDLYDGATMVGRIPAVQAQISTNYGKEVDKQRKRACKTVIKLTDEIYQKGEKEKNSPQMLKAYAWRMKYREMLNPDSLYAGLKGLEQWVKQTDQPMDRAILHSLIAGIYANYAANNQWQLRQRTEIVGQTPSADIREWTANMFVEKVRTNVKEALADSVLLLKTSSRDYIPFVELGKTSEYYHHDLYHLLASRGIDALLQVEKLGSGYTETNAVNPQLDITATTGNMLSAYKAAGLKEGYVLTALNYLEWRRGAERYIRPLQKGEASVLTDDTYLKALNTLKSKYASEPICAEVYLAQARYAIEKQQQVNALQLCDEAIRLYPGYDESSLLNLLKRYWLLI